MKIKKKYIILALVLQFNIAMRAQDSASALAGEYFLEGVMETASVIELRPDSSFRFFYSYGALDRYGSGVWKIKDGRLILNSRARPASRFKLSESRKTTDSFITIQISDKNRQILKFVACEIKSKSRSQEANADGEGIAVFPRQQVESISLVFTICPDSYSTISIANQDQNYFVFQFEPWIAEIFFEQFPLRVEKTQFTGGHPLLEGNHFRYVKGAP